MKSKHFAFGCMFAFLMMGCASFSYRYYGMDSNVSYEKGVLTGKEGTEGWPDIPFSFCAPSAATNHPCVIMKSADFFAMKLDYEDLKSKLDECQRKQP